MSDRNGSTPKRYPTVKRLCPILLSILLLLPIAGADDVFELNDEDYVLIEAENLDYSDHWEFHDRGENTRILGRGYLKYVGPTTGSGHGQEIDEDGSLQPAEEHWLKITVLIERPGRYRIDLRNHHLKKDGDNDIWVHIKGWPPPVRRVGDHAVESYQWLTWGPEWTYWDITEPGVYTFYVAGRSHGFGVDRIAIYGEGAPVTMYHRSQRAANE